MLPTRPTTVAFAIEGPLARSDVSELTDRVSALLARSGAAVALCDVSGARADAVTVDALARLQLAARRSGCEVRLCGAPDELRELLVFVGLGDVVRA